MATGLRKRGATISVKLSAKEVVQVDRLCREFWPSLKEPKGRATVFRILLREFGNEARKTL